MKSLFIMLAFSLWFCSCTMASKNQHYQLSNYSDKSFQKAEVTWCFNSSMHTQIMFCSPMFSSYSTAFGFIFPVIPIKDRTSKLAVDVQYNRIVTVHNYFQDTQIHLTELSHILLCTDARAQDCQQVSSLSIDANQSVILKLPQVASVQILFEVNEHIYYETLESFTDKHWDAIVR